MSHGFAFIEIFSKYLPMNVCFHSKQVNRISCWRDNSVSLAALTNSYVRLELCKITLIFQYFRYYTKIIRIDREV